MRAGLDFAIIKAVKRDPTDGGALATTPKLYAINVGGTEQARLRMLSNGSPDIHKMHTLLEDASMIGEFAAGKFAYAVVQQAR